MTECVNLFTDGACRGNPGPGGWGALLVYKDSEKELYGGEKETTNNRMELQAVISGLHNLSRSCCVNITTDSKYVKQGMTEWINNWKRKNWKTSAGKAVKNKDLWILLDEQVARHQVQWFWVKGHSGHDGNERADQLANRGIDELI